MPAESASVLEQQQIGPLRPRRLVVALVLLALAIAPNGLGALTRELMLDAWFAVSAFVAATLLLFYGGERLFKADIGAMLSRARGWQVPVAALLGATPGCGGAVIVVAAYASGRVGFGAVVATLTATMGDAAFLLIATRPDAAVVLLPLCFAVGTLSGWVVDALRYAPARDGSNCGTDTPRIGALRRQDRAFVALALPGLAIGLTDLIAPDLLDRLPSGLAATLGLAGVALMAAIWATSPVSTMTNPTDPPATRAAEETAFITIWVLGAFLGYEYAVEYLGLDLAGLFGSIAVLLPLMGVLVGLIPGCGPQILVTTLFINGTVPFAALVGNAISNDGDALFPALAVNPRAALLATLVSAVPAVIVAYGFYLLVPGFLN